MKNRRRIIVILCAAVLAVVGTVALVGYVQSAKDKVLAEEALVEVYVVDQFVPQGAAAETIKASVSIEQIPARLEQPGTILNLDDIGENVAGADLQPGDQLLAARLVPKDEVTDAIDDKVQVSALLSAERAVGGTLEKGDLVGVYLSFDPFETDEAGQATGATDGTAETVANGSEPPAEAEADTKKTPNVTRLEFQHVLVANVQTTNNPVVTEDDDDDTDEPQIAQVSDGQYIVTLALSPEQSERFVFAAEFGHVWLSSQPATVSDDGTRLVTLGNVYAVVM